MSDNGFVVEQGTRDPMALPTPWKPKSLSSDDIQRVGRRSSSRNLLEKDISPFDLSTISIYGADVVEKNDPILIYLAHSDEKEYKKMIDSDTAIGGAVEQRISGVLSAGSEVIPGPSRSRDAVEFAKFAISLLKMVPKLGTFNRESLLAIQHGWTPVEKQWKFGVNLTRPNQWGLARMVKRKPWNYFRTLEGYLVRKPSTQSNGKAEVLDSPAEQMRYCSFTAGSTESPYGEAFLRRVWLLFFLSKKFERMSAQQMQRSLGLIKVKLSNTKVGATRTDLDADLERVLTMLNSYNVLWEIAGATLEFVETKGITDNTTKLLDYFNSQKRIAIVGQNLSSEVRAGSFAATQTHVDEVLRSYVEADAREWQDWINDEIIRPAIILNFGEQHEMDMPKFRSKLFRNKIDLEATKAYFDFGGKIDARKMAESDIPAALPEDDSPQYLQKQNENSDINGPGRPRKDNSDGERNRGRNRNTGPNGDQPTRRDRVDAELDYSISMEIPDDDGEDVDEDDPHSILSAHYRHILSRFERTNPDPKVVTRR